MSDGQEFRESPLDELARRIPIASLCTYARWWVAARASGEGLAAAEANFRASAWAAGEVLADAPEAVRQELYERIRVGDFSDPGLLELTTGSLAFVRTGDPADLNLAAEIYTTAFDAEIRYLRGER
jgi:hypothetical protein